jgi:hypothetical protein
VPGNQGGTVPSPRGPWRDGFLLEEMIETTTRAMNAREAAKVSVAVRLEWIARDRAVVVVLAAGALVLSRALLGLLLT